MGKRRIRRRGPFDVGACTRAVVAVLNTAGHYTSRSVKEKASTKAQTASAVCSALRSVGLSTVVATRPNTAIQGGTPTNVYSASEDWLMGRMKTWDGRPVETEDEKVEFAMSLLTPFWASHKTQKAPPEEEGTTFRDSVRKRLKKAEERSALLDRLEAAQQDKALLDRVERLEAENKRRHLRGGSK